MKFQKNSLVKPPEKVIMVNIMNPKEFENKDNEDYIESFFSYGRSFRRLFNIIT
jgi:hypothetical protein